MACTKIIRTINAPVARVFDVVANAENFAEAVPQITHVEFITAQHAGLGTEFRETRVMRGRQATTTLEVTDYAKNERIRMVSDEGGTIWDTVFTLAPEGESTRLEVTMDANAYQLTARVMNALLKRIISKAIEADMDAVKTFCERRVD